MSCVLGDLKRQLNIQLKEANEPVGFHLGAHPDGMPSNPDLAAKQQQALVVTAERHVSPASKATFRG